jgi:diguanylate cyclase (GGDEF)-like protein/PAS domain S-box-containing protein
VTHTEAHVWTSRVRFRHQAGWATGLTVLFAVGLTLPGIVFFSEPTQYTILHTVLEFTSMAISLMIVALAWNLRDLEHNSQVMIIGWFSLGVLVVDMAHTLSFPGMPALATESTAQKAITFWLAGRIAAAVGFLLLALVPTRHWSPRLWLPGIAVTLVAALSATWIGLYYTQWVPTFFVPGEGLTSTKVVIEYALSAAYALSAVLLLRRARRESSRELAWLATAAWTLVLAELYFTLYVNVADVFNLLGHVLKVIAYLMVYRAIFVAGVQDPYRRLARETSLMRSLIDSVPDLISFTDQNGRLLGVNRAFSTRFHVDADEVVGRSPVDVAWADGRNRARLPRLSDDVARFEEAVPDGAGSLQVFDTLQTPYFTLKGERLGVIEISRDVTAQRAAEERIHHLALYDQLTGLPNRVLLGDEARESFADPALLGQAQALVFLDLDDFKTINDTVGHRMGDLLIQEAAQRLLEAAGPDAHVARLGGDEFAILAAPSSLQDATALVTRLVAAIDRPFRIERYDLTLTASAGIAMYPTDGTTFDELVVRADSAMYRAKMEGRHTYRFFSGDMLANAAERLELLTALRKAVENDELVVHYQPQVSLTDGSIVGVEALVRWAHPTLGLLPPASFIGLAEESGLILPIGEAVLNRALADAVVWDQAGARPISVAVNLSAVQFVQTDLTERIRLALLRSGLPPERLEVEITETIAMVSPDMAVTAIERLHRMGVQVSIDDFGTGYSSMAYLKRFRIDKLKIDRSFVQDLGRDPDDEAIVTAVIQVAKSLRCVTIAEGVETHEQQEFLRSRGCDMAQGFHLHRPMPADAVAALLRPVMQDQP